MPDTDDTDDDPNLADFFDADIDPDDYTWLEVECPSCGVPALVGEDIEGIAPADLEDRDVHVVAVPLAPPEPEDESEDHEH